MEDRFLEAFVKMNDRLMENRPYDWIFDVITTTAADSLGPKDMNLRADGAAYLASNIASMIVIPWERAEGSDFERDKDRLGLLREDVRRLLDVAALRAASEGRNDVSANMLLQATAFFGELLTIRGLRLWGP